MEIKILVVDDDPAILRLLAKHVTAAGHHVLTAANGQEAMRVMLSHAPSIVITDWGMPEMDGLELCREIRAHEWIGFVYVILLTAHHEDDDIVRAFEAGADDYLSKPVNLKTLVARLRAGQRIVQLQEDLERRTLELHRINAQMEIVNSELAAANQKLNIMAAEDDLTGLTNRREAMSRLRDAWTLSRRNHHPLSCILLDIDHFKKVNDTYGHDVGDLVLREVAGVLQASARSAEPVARIGGEEFLVICPGSGEQQAAAAAERFRRAVEDLRVDRQGADIGVTVSSGVASRSPATTSPDGLLKLADTALYEAKRSGRNRVCRASEQDAARQEQTRPGPTTRTSPPSPEEPSGSSRPPPPSGPDRAEAPPARILVVSPDAQKRTSYRKCLHGEAYRVTEAAGAEDVLRRAEQAQAQVILVDAGPSGAEALACARRLKANPETRDIPLLLIGPRPDAETLEQLYEAGVDDYLTERLSPEQLSLRLHSMLSLHQSRQELVSSYQARGEQARAMATMLDFSHHMAACEDLDTILDTVVQVTAHLTCSRRVSVMLPDADGRYLSVAGAIGLERNLVDQARFPTDSGLTGRVYSTGGLELVETEGDRTRRCHEHEAELFVEVPLISAALVASSRTVGVINLSGHERGRGYTDLDLEYVHLIRSAAASAIHSLQSRRARDQARDSVVVALAKLAEHRDRDTGRHLDRVTRFSLLLAEHLSTTPRYRDIIDHQFLYDLERAVPLHDIGKVAVPDRILLKPGTLTAEEMAVMRTHAEIGARTLQSLVERPDGASFLKMAEDIAHFHHERYDGRGYPLGLKGEQIPLPARIAALADLYDAMTTQRAYKEALSHQEAATVVRRQAGKHFDPAVAEAFTHREHEFVALARALADHRTDEERHRRATDPAEYAESLLVHAT